MSGTFDIAAGLGFRALLGRIRSTQDGAALAFKAGIMTTMLAPLLIYAMHTAFAGHLFWRPFYFLIPLIGILSGTHVFATTYLYVQTNSFRGVRHRFVLLYFAPLVIVAVNVYAVTLLPLGYLLWFMVFFVHYALFHFGRQNIGVLSFVTLTSARRPIDRREKLILNGVVACGMCGALKLFSPGLMLDPAKYHLDLSPIAGAIPVLYDIGVAGYVVVLALAAHRFFTNRHAYDMFSAIIFWLCVVWYLPIYVAFKYPLLSLAAFTTAHGLQYLVFLALHAYGNSQRRFVLQRERASIGIVSKRAFVLAAVPCVLFLAILYAGYFLWQNSAVMFAGGGGTIDGIVGAGGVAKVGAGFIAGLTMAHYWVDQFIWRFKTPQRREWLLDNYPFLNGSWAGAAARRN